MKLHCFLMCTILYIHNVTVVASVIIQFDSTIRNNQHIYNTLLVNRTTTVLFAGTRPSRYSDHPAPQPYKRLSCLSVVAALALIQLHKRWHPIYRPGTHWLYGTHPVLLVSLDSSQAARTTSSPTSVTILVGRFTNRILHKICSRLGSEILQSIALWKIAVDKNLDVERVTKFS